MRRLLVVIFAHLWDSALQVNLDSYGDEAHRRKLSGMKGIQIMTGKPTKRMNGEIVEYLVVLDIESRLFTELEQIHQLFSNVAPEETASNTPTRIVERVEIGELHIEFDDKGQSQYLPLAQCLSAVPHTRDQTCKSVRYTQGHGELIGFCFNCEHEWRIPQLDVPQPHTDQSPSYRHFTKELRTVSTQVLGIPSTNNWQPRLEPLHSHPHIEPPNRRIYAQNEAVECKKCGHSHAVPSIDRYTLTAHHFCQHCGHDAEIGSYLKYELNRKLKNALISDYSGYLADDPLLAEESLWNTARWFHLAAPMGAGKTTLIYHRAREAAETGAITIIVVPRVSLAKAIFN